MTPRATVNLLVIGRSPRPALEAEFHRVLGDGCDLRTIGALDHLDISSIEANPPRSDADTLFSILPDGQSTLLSKAHVTEELRTRLRARQPDDNEIDVLCCTGRFDEFAGDRVIKASEVLLNTVRGVGSVAQSVGVFIPKPQQVANAVDRWKAGGFTPNVFALAPDASDDEIDRAAATMRDLVPDIVVYDCISYTHATRLRVSGICPAPAIVAASAMAHVVAELLAL